MCQMVQEGREGEGGVEEELKRGGVGWEDTVREMMEKGDMDGIPGVCWLCYQEFVTRMWVPGDSLEDEILIGKDRELAGRKGN